MTEYVLGFCFGARLVMVLLIRKTRPEGPEGRTEVQIVDSIVSKEVSGSLVLPNLRYLLPMALNHLRGDEASFFVVREEKEPC